MPSNVISFEIDNDDCADYISIACVRQDSFENHVSFLSQEELARLNDFKSEKRKKEFAAGRAAAKLSLMEIDHGLSADNIVISNDDLGAPVVNADAYLAVSISHADNYAIAVGFAKQYSFGIDIERVDERNIKALNRLTSSVDECIPSDVESLTCAWALKEAFGKCVKVGLRNAVKITSYNRLDDVVNCSFLYHDPYVGQAFVMSDISIAIAYESRYNIDISYEKIKTIVQ